MIARYMIARYMIARCMIARCMMYDIWYTHVQSCIDDIIYSKDRHSNRYHVHPSCCQWPSISKTGFNQQTWWFVGDIYIYRNGKYTQQYHKSSIIHNHDYIWYMNLFNAWSRKTWIIHLESLSPFILNTPWKPWFIGVEYDPQTDRQW
jgi:hypothetical protein